MGRVCDVVDVGEDVRYGSGVEGASCFFDDAVVAVSLASLADFDEVSLSSCDGGLDVVSSFGDSAGEDAEEVGEQEWSGSPQAVSFFVCEGCLQFIGAVGRDVLVFCSGGEELV